MYFLLSSHEMCLLLNCVAEARYRTLCVKTSVLPRPKEGERCKLVVLDFCCFSSLTATVGDPRRMWTEHPSVLEARLPQHCK